MTEVSAASVVRVYFIITSDNRITGNLKLQTTNHKPKKPPSPSYLCTMSRKTYQEYSRTEEILNIITHGVGIPLAITGLVMLTLKAEQRSDAYLYAGIIYGISMLGTYLTSTLYHGTFNLGSKIRNWFHLLDHAAIYVFIAGTYTPIAYFMLPEGWNWGILAGVWAFALIGVVFKLVAIGKYKKLSLALYLMMGWLIVIAAKPLWETAPHNLVYWIIAGGAFYSLGTVFFSLRKVPYSHAIWHLLVLGGSICHFVGIYIYV